MVVAICVQKPFLPLWRAPVSSTVTQAAVARPWAFSPRACPVARGTATIVGVLPPDAMIEFPWMAIRPECKVQTSRMGSNRFRIDIPLYLDFYRQGRLDLDSMVTKRGHLGDINEAFRAMKAGEVARTVLTFD